MIKKQIFLKNFVINPFYLSYKIINIIQRSKNNICIIFVKSKNGLSILTEFRYQEKFKFVFHSIRFSEHILECVTKRFQLWNIDSATISVGVRILLYRSYIPLYLDDYSPRDTTVIPKKERDRSKDIRSVTSKHVDSWFQFFILCSI